MCTSTNKTTGDVDFDLFFERMDSLVADGNRKQAASDMQIMFVSMTVEKQGNPLQLIRLCQELAACLVMEGLSNQAFNYAHHALFMAGHHYGESSAQYGLSLLIVAQAYSGCNSKERASEIASHSLAVLRKAQPKGYVTAELLESACDRALNLIKAAS